MDWKKTYESRKMSLSLMLWLPIKIYTRISQYLTW